MRVQFRDNTDGDQFFALRTYRRDGTAVSTPIWLAPAGGRWYGYTPGRSWKVLRIRRNPRIAVAPSSFEGEPHGDWREGTARILPTRELRRAKRAMTAKHGNKFRVFVLVTALGWFRRRGGPAVGLEITLDTPAAA
ncbi:PPOX class F420-dependent oxidoreductase [Spiractinospora alimapuensis]|uniref:PPOX class F420-dependent oxidoreductase n=1 Tax=Spiractinospora alimapuensis TaxID=2820884 RepID=UPI001F27D43E|nr:PPOX class F420-dependent oxidoreductase [Spiractinospora alimapuensis]QVQ52737.1 PPOX class F420-dependent oxidoreductase [Spiractinospora alimapuensis]